MDVQFITPKMVSVLIHSQPCSPATSRVQEQTGGFYPKKTQSLFLETGKSWWETNYQVSWRKPSKLSKPNITIWTRIKYDKIGIIRGTIYGISIYIYHYISVPWSMVASFNHPLLGNLSLDPYGLMRCENRWHDLTIWPYIWENHG